MLFRLLIFGAALGGASAVAQSWTPTGAPTNSWAAMACSADGARVVAAVSNNRIYVSSDAGTNWAVTSAPALQWRSVASSANGSNLIACATGVSFPFGGVYSSTDAGQTWTSNQLSASLNWITVASSADGSTFYAAPNGNELVYLSTNSGAGWLTRTNHLADVYRIACSGDGTLVVGGDNNRHLEVSHDAGATWSTNSAVGNSLLGGAIQCVNVAGAGQRLTAALSLTVAGGIFCSTNQGASWYSNSLPGSYEWTGAGSSADGLRLTVVAQKGQIYSSIDGGTTWHSNDAPGLNWQAVASSADGTVAFAAAANGGIWQRRLRLLPLLVVANASNALALTWLIPSSAQVLQQNPNLDPVNWTDVTNAPDEDLTNLRQRLLVPVDAAAWFYRLRSR